MRFLTNKSLFAFARLAYGFAESWPKSARRKNLYRFVPDRAWQIAVHLYFQPANRRPACPGFGASGCEKSRELFVGFFQPPNRRRAAR